MIVSKFLSCVHTAILAWNCGTAWKCLVKVPWGSAVRKYRSEVPRESASMKCRAEAPQGSVTMKCREEASQGRAARKRHNEVPQRSAARKRRGEAPQRIAARKRFNDPRELRYARLFARCPESGRAFPGAVPGNPACRRRSPADS